ncbi:MAG: hypothetical protein R3F60_26395 [bacterium]
MGQLRQAHLVRGGDDVLFYDDAVPAGTITAAPPMGRRRFGHIAAELPEGRVLLAGGVAPARSCSTPPARPPSSTLALTDAAELHAAHPGGSCPAAFAADDAEVAPAVDAGARDGGS